MYEEHYVVEGMTCGHCVSAVRCEVSEIPTVRSVALDLATGRLTVRSDRPIALADLVGAVEEAGYQVRPG